MNDRKQHMQHAIHEYLEAVAESFGEDYRQAMVVEPRGSEILFRHPDAAFGEMVPVGYMPILTRNTRNGWFRKHAA